MIDGVKILVSKDTAISWAKNPLLRFSSNKDEETSERVGLSCIAEFQGLIFKIYFDKDTDGIRYGTFQGSLHKYFNKGIHNRNDFTFYDLQDVLQELSFKFSIVLLTSIIQNLEYGVNIYTLIPAKEVVDSVVAYKGYAFRFFEIKRKRDGQKIDQPQQSSLKIYNKGKADGVSDNLLRFEKKALKSIYLKKKFDIETLADLTDLTKMQRLADDLHSCWNDIIYYDKKINYRALTNHQQKKVLYWATPRNWQDYTNKERYKQRIRFKDILSKYGSSSYKDIGSLIDEKCKELTAPKRGQINRVCKEIKQHQKGDELTEYVNGYFVPQNPQKTNLNILPKNHQKYQPKKANKKRICKSCENDISHKRVNAKYCDKKCNNISNGIIRTMKNRKRIVQEKQDLIRLLKLTPKNKFWLMISYKTDSGIYTDTLKQSEIKTSKDWIKSVQKVLVTEYRKNAPPIILRSYRARKLLSEINTRNGI
ncbi:hypothetical protein [Tenacibaculum finnmarkense]|uniref:hypothetical protein n=1 Tax=Tenacibaculum finnmarkense TaxID=2781243 RepID=UPI00187B6412|nr:hypothetical protein [Tenacibaculum finnmarkense]MBE7646074.1 hypothetical protein [Tenacibaculum finnmarkense genomovar ulcerans]MBE7660091.1 hypothetical protein [Tenacibaculum finnmarkense genomovar finnmarkense]MCD8416590.1 hypothetical protein [Tenacibaculum finnmarkense genomovar finnmarkense]MCG8185207.1 hypothetical protein [Tenacibaculum finnmarkense genomovar finnmarkense]MCG8201524.1 hypothetical protein [Tenacibaculum finnmarkense genomovar finnmarkense]